MRELTFTIPGKPAPQGSKSISRSGHMYEQNPGTKAWRTDVIRACKDALGPDHEPLDGPLSVEVVFYLQRPQRPKFDAPAVKPDVDKLTRNTLDGLTQAGVIVDDARVTRITASKEYATHTTGCVLTVKEQA